MAGGLLLTGMWGLSGCVPEDVEAVPGDVAGKMSKILNRHRQMAYRRLGKTDLMVSEIVLAGQFGDRRTLHVGSRGGGENVSAEVARNRTEVVSACIDCGINYLDVTSGQEALAYRAALKGRRERMYVAADDRTYCMRHERHRNVDSQMQNIESCLTKLGTDYLDVWRLQCKKMDGHRDVEMEMCVEVFERARQQGKVRFLGVGTCDRTWIGHLLDHFGPCAVIYTPYTLRSETTVSDLKAIDRNQLYEPSSWGGHREDTADKLFESARARETGVIATEPFGTTVQGQERARLTLACVLCNPDLSAVAVPMHSASQVQAFAEVSAQRRG